MQPVENPTFKECKMIISGSEGGFPPEKVHDRINEYLVSSGELLWRPLRSEDRAWFKTNFPAGRTPVEAKTCFENLMVLDDQRAVHYTKTSPDMTNPPWSKGIFVLPVIGEIFNRMIYSNPNIQVPPGEKWSCSFLEPGTSYIDANGQTHHLGNGSGEIEATTTAYVSDRVTRKFRFYDPYLPKWPEDDEKLFIPFPETSKNYFDLKGMDSCRSSLFCLGYDVSKADGGGVVKELTCYFMPCDANLLGLNPFITYTYSKKPSYLTDFALPAVRYQKMTLPQGEGVRLTDVVSMERRGGEGMTDLVLKIQGSFFNLSGYFFKGVKDEFWGFKQIENYQIESDKYLPLRVFDPIELFSTTVFDYKGNASHWGFDAEMKNFGENSQESTILLDVKGDILELKLYRKLSRWNILGFDWRDYTLVVCPEYLNIIQWKDADCVIPVLVEGDKDQMLIKVAKTSELLFEFALKED